MIRIISRFITPNVLLEELISVIILVLSTSIGVVRKAAVAPALAPHIHRLKSLFSFRLFFKYSYNGYCIIPNGISLRTVTK